MTSPHLALLTQHVRFGNTVTNLKIIGRVSTAENLGVYLLIQLWFSGSPRCPAVYQM